MFRILLCICIALAIIPFLSCGDKNNVSKPENESQLSSWSSDEKENEILKVLYERWKEGYESKHLVEGKLVEWGEGKLEERVKTYISAFWSDFQRVLDDGTIIKKNRDEEKDAAEQVFKNFKDIVMEIPDPIIDFSPGTEAEAKIGEEAEVKTSYKIQFILKDNVSDQCVYKGYYAEGEVTFTFKFGTTEDGKNEWRIARLEDTAYSLDKIKQRNPIP